MIKLTHENGWIAKDEFGIQYPWYTSGMLEVLDKMDLNGKKVFEYGVGYSTLWYRSRGVETFGVDSNKEWADKIGVKLFSDQQHYLETIVNSLILGQHQGVTIFGDHYDLIIIDGLFRDFCTWYSLMYLKSGGMLIIDNWMQPSVEPNEWTKTLKLTKDLKGEIFKQEGHPDWKTAYWIK